MKSGKASSQSHQVGYEKVRSAHRPRMMNTDNDSEHTQKFVTGQQEVRSVVSGFFYFS